MRLIHITNFNLVGRKCGDYAQDAYFEQIVLRIYFFIDYFLIILSNQDLDLPKSQIYVIGLLIAASRIISFILCKKFSKNFGKGLKEEVYPKLNLGLFVRVFAQLKIQDEQFEFKTKLSIRDVKTILRKRSILFNECIS